MSSAKIFRIREARELRGMTVNELADKIDVSKQAVYTYEKGTVRPTAATLENISVALDFPVAFFEAPREGATLDSEPIFFRSMKSTLKKKRTQAERWMQLILERIQYYEKHNIVLPDVNLPSYDVDFRTITFEEIEDLAVETRKYWGLGNAPISNVTLLLENNGFIISEFDLESDKLDACSVLSNGRPYILINTSKYTCSRQIMNLAHELGHLILHTQVEKEDLDNESLLSLIEKQAWRFAGAFLMPMLTFSAEVSRVTLDFLLTLKRRWRTAVSAMIMRCSDLGIIDDYRKQYLFREYARKKYRKNEPLDDVLETEKPSTLLLCDEVLITEMGLTKEDLLADSRIGPENYVAIIGGPSDYFSPPKPKLRVLYGV